MCYKFNYLLAVLALNLSASLDDYIFRYSTPSYSNFGMYGLVNMPSGRMPEAGNIGATYSNFGNFSRITLSASPFERFQASYHYSEVKDKLYSLNYQFSGNQSYKDKGFDVKFLVIKETKFLPNLAIGFNDIGGTGLFSGEYIVASKYYKNIDFTLGSAWGALSVSSLRNPFTYIDNRFNNRSYGGGALGGEFSISNFFRGQEFSIFGGIEYYIPYTNGKSIKIEYDTHDYDVLGGTSADMPSRWNISLVLPFSQYFKTSLQYLNNNNFAINFSVDLNYAKQKSIVNKLDAPLPVPQSRFVKIATAREDRLLYLATLRYMTDRNLNVNTVGINDEVLSVGFSQNTYLSFPRSYGRAFDILDQISPDSIKTFEIIPMNAGFEIASISTSREVFKKYKESENNFLLADNLSIEPSNNNISNHQFRPKIIYPTFFYKAGPTIQSHIGGPDRFFIGGLNFRVDAEILLNKGLSLEFIGRQNLADTFEQLDQPSDSILPHVRTDIIEYLKEGDEFTIPRMQLNFFRKLSNSIYWKLTGGVFEEMFGGIGGEILYRNFNKDWAISLEAFEVKQREYDQLFSFRDYRTKTGHLNFYYHHPRSNILFNISGGKYLAGDSGFTFDFSRRFQSGLRLGAFLSFTDISQEEFGEGSFDKGFYITFPLEAFFTNYSRELTSFSLKPITRDGAARLVSGFRLYDITEQASRSNILRDLNDFYD